MRACWRGLSRRQSAWVFGGVCLCVRAASRSLSDTSGEPKCEGTQRVSVKFPPRVRSFAPGDAEWEFWGQTERYCGLSSQSTQGPAALLATLPAVLCIIIHRSPQPQTPSSHHLSCCCHSDFKSDLSLSCPPAKSTTLMGKVSHSDTGGNVFCSKEILGCHAHTRTIVPGIKKWF